MMKLRDICAVALKKVMKKVWLSYERRIPYDGIIQSAIAVGYFCFVLAFDMRFCGIVSISIVRINGNTPLNNFAKSVE